MLVSVIVPAYNVEQFVEATVRSLLAQTYRELEIIVVDDGSTDSTPQVLARLADPRLRVVRFDNGGLPAARNRGWELAQGEVLAFLDADDLWDPEKVERSLPLLQESVAVGSRMRYIGEDGRRLPAAAGEAPDAPGARERIARADLMPFPISSILFDRAAAEAAGRFDEALPQVEDLDFLSRVALVGPITWVPEPLGSYRMRASSLSATRFAEQRRTWRFVQARRAAEAEGRTLTRESFLASYRPDPREERQVRVAALYRQGGLELAQRRPSGARYMLQAALLNPAYVLKRLRMQARS